MSEPMIVLHVVGRMDIGGAESRIMDLYRHIDRTKVQFAFCQHTTDRCAFEDEIESLGGKVYHVPRFHVLNYFSYKKAWKQLLREHQEIRAVHGHMTSTAAIYLPIAKRQGVEITIAHARSAGVDPGLKGHITRFLRRNLYKKCDYRFTCSEMAGESVFGDQKNIGRKAKFFPNAIDADKFVFSEETREEIRYEYILQNKFVIGHVGRFSHMKNHKYLLEILEQCIVLEKEKGLPETVLMLLGDGELKEEIMELAVQKGLSSRVLFMGNKKDVYRYYQAMDYFLLPSIYEGLPGTAIEAQASGLPGIMSDTITPEAVVTPLLVTKSIKDNAGEWAAEIMKTAEKMFVSSIDKEPAARDSKTDQENISTEDRKEYADRVRKAGFDVKEQAVRMEKFYLSGKWE